MGKLLDDGTNVPAWRRRSETNAIRKRTEPEPQPQVEPAQQPQQEQENDPQPEPQSESENTESESESTPEKQEPVAVAKAGGWYVLFPDGKTIRGADNLPEGTREVDADTEEGQALLATLEA